ncbi:DUF2066 domain-containing protein [Wenzhouxiangella sp. XN79A]|uniref:DUF2066 domain-containing protein n=1 Tax=Wenzhouxiangella sp. XN79A TaxID=2724193 RepID=UPI00144A5B88|nr:DUF2066 domain-containing protein [Wenzhouxiangella sp. XN79A]NKI34340.1 DUF2066 domain-containing protein [Wenzhouxiangella sp. XN79A]
MHAPRFVFPIVSTILLALALVGPAAARSSGQAALYVGEVPAEPLPVADADPLDGRAEPLPPLLAALNQVLVRVTGQVGADLVAELGIDRAEALSLSLARQYREVEVPMDDRAARLERRLRVDFDPIAIDRRLDDAGLARWGRERPEMLLWIAEEGPGGAQYLEPDPQLNHSLDQAMFRYGLSITRPILDAFDRIEVTPSDIRGGFAGLTDAARERYGADGVILLDLRQGPRYWTGRWVWRLGDLEFGFARSGATPEEVVELGIARIAAALAARFAVRPDVAERRRLVVSGIDRPIHYAEVRGFLAGLTGVESVRLLGAAGSTLTFELDSSANGLQQRIELSGPLRFERHDLASGTLYYALAL